MEQLEYRVLLHAQLHVLQDHAQDPALLTRGGLLDDLVHHLCLLAGRVGGGEAVKQVVELADGDGRPRQLRPPLRPRLDHRENPLGKVALLHEPHACTSAGATCEKRAAEAEEDEEAEEEAEAADLLVAPEARGGPLPVEHPLRVVGGFIDREQVDVPARRSM